MAHLLLLDFSFTKATKNWSINTDRHKVWDQTEEIWHYKEILFSVPKAHYPKGFFNYNPKFKAAKAAQKSPVKAYNNGIGGRIVGGTDAKRGEFPWMISYQFYDDFFDQGFHACGGSILNANKIGNIFLWYNSYIL